MRAMVSRLSQAQLPLDQGPLQRDRKAGHVGIRLSIRVSLVDVPATQACHTIVSLATHVIEVAADVALQTVAPMIHTGPCPGQLVGGLDHPGMILPRSSSRKEPSELLLELAGERLGDADSLVVDHDPDLAR